MFAVLHSAECNRHVVCPVGAYINQVNIISETQLLVGLRSAVNRRSRIAVVHQPLRTGLCPVGLGIAHGHCPGPRHLGIALDRPGASVPKAYDSDADGVDRVVGIADHSLLSCRHCRNLGLEQSAAVAASAKYCERQ